MFVYVCTARNQAADAKRPTIICFDSGSSLQQDQICLLIERENSMKTEIFDLYLIFRLKNIFFFR